MLLGCTMQGPVYVFDRPPRILIVDDDPIMREFALSQLAMPGATLVTAGDGEEAWAILDRSAEPFDLVLSDLEMPVLTGFGLVERVRADARFAGLPIVVITSREDMFAIDRAYEVGATSFVTKPVNWRLLGYQLRYVLRAARMEGEVRLARDEAARAADLKRNLLALLQHETRTPLHAIIGYAEILRRAIEEPAALRDAVDQVLAASRTLGGTLQRVFTFSQLISGTHALDRETVSLAHVVAEALRPAEARAAGRGVAIALTAEDGAARIDCDLRALSTAIDEVVTNAIAHAPAGSEVSVSLRREGANLLLTVADQGPGMAEAVLARCTEAFAQDASALTRSREGLGLGLATARRIMDLHGGTLAIESAPDAGTRVTLSLPVAAEAPLALAG